MSQDRRKPTQGLLVSSVVAIPAFALAASVGTRQVFLTALGVGVLGGLGLSRMSTYRPLGALIFVLALFTIAVAPMLLLQGWWPAGPLVVFLLAGIIAVAVQIFRSPPNDPRSAARARDDDEGGGK